MKKYNQFRFSALTWQQIYCIACSVIMFIIFTHYVVRDYEELADKIDHFESIEEMMKGVDYDGMVE